MRKLWQCCSSFFERCARCVKLGTTDIAQRRTCCSAAFLAVADEEYGRQIPFAFLERIQAEWKEKLADKARSATAHSLDKTFGWVPVAHLDPC